MAKKSKAKPKLKPRTKSVVKPKVKSRVISVAKPKAKPKTKARVMTKTKLTTKPKAVVKAKGVHAKPLMAESSVAVNRMVIKNDVRPSAGSTVAAKPAVPIVKRIVNQMVERRRPVKRPARVNQYSFMKAPGLEHAFEVGGAIEVYCDHEKSKERIRGWVKGIVVQVDNKMVAVQFRSNVYLTDGWMVPDRILWFPLNSEHMRLIPGKKPVTKDLIPDY
jgi:hypothetical protein